jgi:uncharacterized protein YecE (DUF72 family)
MKKGIIHIGISGWSNSSWKGTFYPIELKSADYLSFYSRNFNATEVNSSFYHLPRLTTVEGWKNKVPADFKLCIKMSQYITHTKRLREPEEPLQRLFNSLEPVKKMAGPILIQLPPSLKFDYETVEYFFAVLKKHYKGYDFALEARHISWLTDNAYNLLAKYNIAWVMAEAGNRFPYAEAVTSKNIYVRFHGSKKLYASSYTNEVLRSYADKFINWQKEGHQLWVFFNNTMYVTAIENAITLKKMVDA